MSTVDVATALRLAEGAKAAGGRYLEAPVNGSKKPVRRSTRPACQPSALVATLTAAAGDTGEGGERVNAQAEEARLVVLAAGDATLFDELQPVFALLAKHTFFLGECGQGTCTSAVRALFSLPSPGCLNVRACESAPSLRAMTPTAAKTKLVSNMLLGDVMAALSESFMLADKAGVNLDQLLQVLALSSVGSPLLGCVAAPAAAPGLPRRPDSGHVEGGVRREGGRVGPRVRCSASATTRRRSRCDISRRTCGWRLRWRPTCRSHCR